MLKAVPRSSAPWSAAHPLWLCGLRPFFLFAILAAPLLIGLWSAFLAFGAPLPAVAGGLFVWHAHELIFGFCLAAVAGFLLTAVPEFTDTAAFSGRAMRLLAGAWLLGRAAYWASGLLGAPALVISAVAHLGLLGGLVVLLAPRLWRDPERRHLAFLWTLGALALCIAGFYADALSGAHPARWLHAALGVLMILIVVAMSRISMRIVNHALDEAESEGVEYRALPPRRNLAIFCIGLYTTAEFFAPGTHLSGWLALAAAAAVLNLLNDWHVGRVLFRRWPFLLYCVYVLMAAGYAVMGLSIVFGGGAFSAGRHLLAVGALGLAVLVVISIAGRVHTGHALDERPWVPGAAALIVAAAVAWAGGGILLISAGLLWAVAFTICAWRMAPLFLTPRTDGGTGCEGKIIMCSPKTGPGNKVEQEA